LGVGLTIAKRLAELHGGDITAYSAGRNQGAEFVLSLPRGDDEGDDPDASMQETNKMGARSAV
jgi:signal transduction histidine kinase